LKKLTLQDSYDTPPRPISRWARISPSTVFYTKILDIIYSASRLAERGVYTNERWIQSSLDTVDALESVGGSFNLRGLTACRRRNAPCVFVGNHMSVLETFVLPCLIVPYLPVTFVVKESLIAYPFFKHVMRSRDPIVVDRRNPRENLKTVLTEGRKLLDKNISVVIFPQTTRGRRFDPKKFNTLGIKLARRAGVPVIPFALKTDAWGLGKRIKDFGEIDPRKPVRISFGEPMRIQGAGKEEHQFIIQFISRHLDAWRT
jgi:1-acyl-sn-glycerol-3-phosphate acyltransferase